MNPIPQGGSVPGGQLLVDGALHLVLLTTIVPIFFKHTTAA